MSFATRLYFLLLVAIAGLFGLVFFANNELNNVYKVTSEINDNVVQSLKVIDALRTNFMNFRVDIRAFITNKESAKEADLETNLKRYHDGTTANIAQYLAPDGCLGTSCIYNDKDRDNLKKIETLWRDYDSLMDKVLAEARKNAEGKALAESILDSSFTLAEKVGKAIDVSFDYNLELSATLSADAAKAKSKAINLSLLITIMTALLVTITGLFIIRFVMLALGGEPVAAMEVANKIALGDLTSDIKLKNNDHTSMMAGIKTLQEALIRISNQADAISAGDFNVDVKILSEQDKLGNAINNMMASLRSSKIIDERRNWLNEGNNLLVNTLTGDFSVQNIADAAIAALGRYLDAGRGVIYLMREDEQMLDLFGSYMYTERANLGNSFKIGEGAIGQVARERRPIILTTINNESAPITTGTSSAIPLYTYTYPLLQEDKLLGVVELSSIERFTETKLDMLLRSTEIISSFLYISNQRGKINKLLTIAEQAERASREQNERLQVVNSQMEEQQQQLVQQSEELQQSNLAMEEQQQKLQQQSEELRQANSQMVEQQKLLEMNNEELRVSQSSIDEKAKLLEQSNKYKSQFLANMSHELRTPLNAIILLSKMMADNRDGNLPEGAMKKADVIHRSGNDLLRLINDVLDLSKVEAGRMELNLEEISTHKLIENLRDLFGVTADHNNLEFITEDLIKGKFVSDPDKLNQILRNLLSNAFKFTKSGAVTLTLEHNAAEKLPLRLSVRDSGIGIPKGKIGTIFEAFRQVDGSTSREYGGTGLGLTISLRFAELMGGTINIQSKEGEGSQFTLCLPDQQLAESRKNQILASVPRSLLDDRENVSSDDKTFMLIDDDVEFCRAVVEINHRLKYKTIVSHTARESLDLARKYRPEGILLDLGLPDMDGIDLLTEFKSTSDLKSIPVYVISARDKDKLVAGHNIVGYIQKPISQDQIAAAEIMLLSNNDDDDLPAGILIVSHNDNVNTELVQLIQSKFSDDNRTIQQAVYGDSMQTMFKERSWRAVIINMTGLTVDDAVSIATMAHDRDPVTSLIFYGANDLNEEDGDRLRRYTDSIIADGPTSEQRLLENTERFLKKVHHADEIHSSLNKSSVKDVRLKGKIILVVDDDVRNLYVLTAALEQEGAHVINASNGRRALELLEFEKVDIILTDIMMPEMDGYQTITAIRANPKLATIPIIGLSAKAMPEDRKNILEVGADDYLTKPVNYDLLTNSVALWISKRHISLN